MKKSELNKTKTKLLWVFFSVLVPVQFAPALDRVMSPVLNHSILAAPREPSVSYEFEVVPQGIVLPNCAEGASHLSVMSGEALKTPEGNFRQLRIQGALCTQFGFKQRSESLYLPEDLFLPESDVLQGVWETRTYLGVPSTKRADRLLTVQVRRQQDKSIEISWVPESEFEQPEYRAVRMKVAEQPEEMVRVQDWHPGLLPVRMLYIEIEHPFLQGPLVIEGRLDRMQPR